MPNCQLHFDLDARASIVDGIIPWANPRQIQFDFLIRITVEHCDSGMNATLTAFAAWAVTEIREKRKVVSHTLRDGNDEPVWTGDEISGLRQLNRLHRDEGVPFENLTPDVIQFNDPDNTIRFLPIADLPRFADFNVELIGCSAGLFDSPGHSLVPANGPVEYRFQSEYWVMSDAFDTLYRLSLVCVAVRNWPNLDCHLTTVGFRNVNFPDGESESTR